ncbi:MAG: cob(I)yrinic acid a,c-diamide adenosyltransferase [Candidatus Omnitrophica bacterium]|nr:cob(I)yrinic acid a,c-diamide adenosyltransferase [Candidatus Omnitrophota bacterium]
MIHIYTGNGKGKTTSAFGLAMRASGQGLKVCVFQFLKPENPICGEVISAKKLKNIKVIKCKECHPIFAANSSRSKVKKAATDMLKRAEKALFSDRYDMIILDEIINAIDQDFCGKKGFIGMLKRAPRELELVLTGRGDISDMEGFADYITVMTEKKHPFKKKTGARKGVEY